MDLLTESETEEEKIIPLKKKEKKKHSIRKEPGTEKSWIINSLFLFFPVLECGHSGLYTFLRLSILFLFT